MSNRSVSETILRAQRKSVEILADLAADGRRGGRRAEGRAGGAGRVQAIDGGDGLHAAADPIRRRRHGGDTRVAIEIGAAVAQRQFPGAMTALAVEGDEGSRRLRSSIPASRCSPMGGATPVSGATRFIYARSKIRISCTPPGRPARPDSQSERAMAHWRLWSAPQCR